MRTGKVEFGAGEEMQGILLLLMMMEGIVIIVAWWVVDAVLLAFVFAHVEQSAFVVVGANGSLLLENMFYA